MNEDDCRIDLSAQLTINLRRVGDTWLMSCPQLDIVDQALSCSRIKYEAQKAAITACVRNLAERAKPHEPKPALSCVIHSFRG